MLPVKCELLTRDPELIIGRKRTTLLVIKLNLLGMLFPVLFERQKWRECHWSAAWQDTLVRHLGETYCSLYSCGTDGSVGDKINSFRPLICMKIMNHSLMEKIFGARGKWRTRNERLCLKTRPSGQKSCWLCLGFWFRGNSCAWIGSS